MDANYSTVATNEDVVVPPLRLFGPGYLTTWLVLRLVECILVVVTNTCTIVTILLFPSLRSTSLSTFLLSLGFSDGLYGFSFGVHNIIRLMVASGEQRAYFGTLTRALCLMSTIGSHCSLMCTTWICLDRATATHFPYDYKKKVTIKRCRAFVCGTWAYVSVLEISLGLVKYFSITEDEKYIVLASATAVFPTTSYRYFVVPQTLFFLSCNVLLYWRIVVTVAIQKKKAGGKKNEKLTKMVIIVLTIMLVCWLPGNVFHFVKIPNPYLYPNQYRAFSVLYNFIILTLSVPAFINAFIYAGQHQEYRKACVIMFRCKSLAKVGVDGTNAVNTGSTAASAT